MQVLKAKQLADLLEVSPHELRKWEKQLELDTPRDQKGHRVYDQEWVRYFQAIKQLVNKEIKWEVIRLSLRAPNQPAPQPQAPEPVRTPVPEPELEFVY